MGLCASRPKVVQLVRPRDIHPSDGLLVHAIEFYRRNQKPDSTSQKKKEQFLPLASLSRTRMPPPPPHHRRTCHAK